MEITVYAFCATRISLTVSWVCLLSIPTINTSIIQNIPFPFFFRLLIFIGYCLISPLVIPSVLFPHSPCGGALSTHPSPAAYPLSSLSSSDTPLGQFCSQKRGCTCPLASMILWVLDLLSIVPFSLFALKLNFGNLWGSVFRLLFFTLINYVFIKASYQYITIQRKIWEAFIKSPYSICLI